MGTHAVSQADLAATQKHVSQAAILNASWANGTITSSAAYDAEWIAAIAAVAASTAPGPSGMSLAEFDAAIAAGVSAYLTANPPAKPAFYIWAEENGGIASNGYEWSFGNGATGNDIGVPIMVAARLTHISVNADAPGTTVTIVARKQLSSPGTGTGSVVATTSALNGRTNRVYTLPTPIDFAVGDMLIMQTGTVVGTWTDVRAGFRFEEQ